MASEYERRFLLEAIPNAEPAYERKIRQVYWRLGNGWVLRLRRQGGDSEPDDLISIKGPRHGSERPEFEWSLYSKDHTVRDDELALEAALNLYRAGAAHQVVKTRRGYFLDGLLWDVDEFHFENAGLIIAEIEMRSQDDVLAVSRPPWAVREVTTDKRYNNEHLVS